MNYQYDGKGAEILGKEIRNEKDIEVQSISIEHEKQEATIGNVSLRGRLKHFTSA
jgi:hypothetical protein